MWAGMRVLLWRALLCLFFAKAALAAAPAQRDVALHLGLTPEQAATLYKRLDSQSSYIARLAKNNGIQQITLRAIALELGARSPQLSNEQFVSLIQARATEASGERVKLAELQKSITALDPGGERTQALAAVEQAQRAFDDGRLDDAAAALAALSVLRSSERDAAQQAWLDATDRAAQLAFLRGEMASMDRFYDEKSAALSAQTHSTMREHWRSELQRAENWDKMGNVKGDKAASERAIALYQSRVLPLAPRAMVPLDWAGTQTNLGIALMNLGARESGTARLELAVAAYESALLEQTRARVPLDWAVTQNNLGLALQYLGDRESGTARLARAVEAYEAALLERTRTKFPLDWAATQNNLGIALQRFGEREISVARLEQAAAAYEAALLERTRERVPLDWAATQNNLGLALTRLGQTEGGRAYLDQAVAAFKSALLEQTRAQVPLDWAATQNNLGLALMVIGALDNDTLVLQQSVTAYEAALLEMTRTRFSFLWACAKINIAYAQMMMNQRTLARPPLQQIRATLLEARMVVAEGGHSPTLDFADYVLTEINAAMGVSQ